MTSKEDQLFFLPDSISLHNYFDKVETVHDFVKNTFELPTERQESTTKDHSRSAIHRGLVNFFGESGENNNFSTFVASLVDSAAELLDEYQEEGIDMFLPEPRCFSQSRTWCRGVLENAFLGNIAQDLVAPRKPPGCHGLTFDKMFRTVNQNQRVDVAVEKIKCLIQYFTTAMQDDFTMYEMVIFERILGLDNLRQLEAWRSVKIGSGCIKNITVALMENESAHGFVNFANAVYGYGKIIASCTQEEILQACCPEILVGMLLYGTMPSNTVVLVRNVRRYSKYSGYDETFEFQGPSARPYTQDVLTLDASITSDKRTQFSEECNLRDIQKAFLGFVACATS